MVDNSFLPSWINFDNDLNILSGTGPNNTETYKFLLYASDSIN
jgi:hypothetical protein